MEGCSIGSCDLAEIPAPWLQYPGEPERTDSGWISGDGSFECSDNSSNLASVEKEKNQSPPVTFLKDKERNIKTGAGR
jgi:hypothetical protein